MLICRGWCWLLIGLLVLPAGCTPTKKKKKAEAVEAEVAESFGRLQEAIADLQKRQTEKLWDILSEKSQDDAARRAKAFRADFARRDKEEQVTIAQQLSATVEEIRDKLNGFGYVRMKHETIYDRYWMMVAAVVDHVRLHGDEATVYYKPDDSERDMKSVDFVREDGQWRAILSIP